MTHKSRIQTEFQLLSSVFKKGDDNKVWNNQQDNRAHLTSNINH